MEILISTLFILTLSISSHAFTLASSKKGFVEGWDTPNLEVQVNTSSCTIDIVPYIMDAFKVWNDVATSRLRFSISNYTTATSYARKPIIYCDQNFETNTGAPGNGVAGFAQVAFEDNRIRTGYIVLNNESGKSSNISTFSSNAIASLIAHELGHLVGLGHSEYDYALMYYNIDQEQVPILSADDAAGITYLYPRDEMNGSKPFGCARVEGPPRPPNTDFYVAFGFLVLLIFKLFFNTRRAKLLGSS